MLIVFMVYDMNCFLCMLEVVLVFVVDLVWVE